MPTKPLIQWLWLPLALLCAVLFWLLIGQRIALSTPAMTTDELYHQAMVDAMIADEDEVMELVTLTPDHPLVTWDDAGERVLLLSWHADPETLAPGTVYTAPQGALWTFTDREFAAWYQNHRKGTTNWTLRLEQLIGLPPQTGYTHISGFWVRPQDVIRPAYRTNPTSPRMFTDHSDEVSPDYVDWFNDNMLFSYYDSAYPWTRLGYTYDWYALSGEYGLTEFLLSEGCQAEVAFTFTTQEYLDQISA